ncbi:MAG: TetR/AcrR family transcriptional regulator [Labilithrix sp.]|nr:TetR/AcrR family transcriptional regulator [Labilithrix sp.]
MRRGRSRGTLGCAPRIIPYTSTVFTVHTYGFFEMEQRSHTPKGRAARGKILRVAEGLLAARGFHGTSMRDVADAAGLPLATVVYHFARKEQLYAAVLGEIAAPLVAEIEAIVARGDPHVERLDAIVRALVRWTEATPGRVKLLVRELLDNPSRVAKASRLPLAPVLVGLSRFVEDGAARGAFLPVVPEAAVLHLVGALSYVVAARPTLRRIVGPARDAAIGAVYEREAIALARRVLSATEEERHGSESTSRARAESPRPRGGANDRPRRAADHPARASVRR